jgi:predicted PurR-regulated permease PerM
MTSAFRAFVLRWGDIAWRLVAIGVVVFFAFRILQTISVVVFAVIFALFLAAVLWRPAQWLMARGWKPALASMATIVVAALLLTGLILFIIPQVADSIDTLSSDVTETWESFHDWLIEGPLGLTQQEIDDYTERITEWIQGIGGDRLIGGATAILEFITGAFLVIVITFFMLKDGRTLLEKTLQRTPDETAGKVAVGARMARDSLARYMGGIALVGLFDATLIGVALWLVGAPLVFPLALLVFFGAYIPLVGAFVSGLLAVAVTFVNVGGVQALIMLAVVVIVQQFEGDVIMPLVFGSRLRLHPLVVLLAVAAGGLAFGLAGAFLAVPLIAVAVSVHEAISEEPDGSYLQLARG